MIRCVRSRSDWSKSIQARKDMRRPIRRTKRLLPLAPGLPPRQRRARGRERGRSLRRRRGRGRGAGGRAPPRAELLRVGNVLPVARRTVPEGDDLRRRHTLGPRRRRPAWRSPVPAAGGRRGSSRRACEPACGRAGAGAGGRGPRSRAPHRGRHGRGPRRRASRGCSRRWCGLVPCRARGTARSARRGRSTGNGRAPAGRRRGSARASGRGPCGTSRPHGPGRRRRLRAPRRAPVGPTRMPRGGLRPRRTSRSAASRVRRSPRRSWRVPRRRGRPSPRRGALGSAARCRRAPQSRQPFSRTSTGETRRQKPRSPAEGRPQRRQPPQRRHLVGGVVVDPRPWMRRDPAGGPARRLARRALRGLGLARDGLAPLPVGR